MAEGLLLEQLARATTERSSGGAEDRCSEQTGGVIRSLRNTLAWVAERGAVPDPSSPGYVVTVSQEEVVELWRRVRKLRTETRVLRNSFERAGVRLQPGQGILADRDLARLWVEESLVALSLEEFRLRQAKAELLRSLDESGIPRASAS
jgi:hypothetical protein